MKTYNLSRSVIAFFISVGSGALSAYDSGSTGADGAFNPTVDTELPLPDSGIFNFTDVNIPAGVTVTFSKNAANTPVYILATGDIIVDGIIDVGGGGSLSAGPEPLLTDGDPGEGGPGGFDGGRGARSDIPRIYGANGEAPGGGGRGLSSCGGGGGGYATGGGTFACSGSLSGPGGIAWGSPDLALLVGGAGGGGGGPIDPYMGQGGAGGGGAILLAATEHVVINGSVIADGGDSADQVVDRGGGGGGSGGAIRIVADRILGEGVISAMGGVAGVPIAAHRRGGDGGEGFVRLEATFLDRLSATTPDFVYSQPRPALLSQLPALRISRFAGEEAPLQPTGDGDIVLPGFVPNPVTVEAETQHIPLGTAVTFRVMPKSDAAFTVVGSGVTGSDNLGTSTADIDMPSGPSSLQVYTTFTVVASVGDALSRFAQGERVEKVSVMATAEGSVTELTTVTGKTYRVPAPG